MRRKRKTVGPIVKHMPAYNVEQASNGGFIATHHSYNRDVLERYAFSDIDGLIAFLRAAERASRTAAKVLR